MHLHGIPGVNTGRFHRVLGVHGASLDVWSVPVDHAQQTAPLGRYSIRVFALHCMTRHCFVNADRQELVLVVFAHLRFSLLFGPARRDWRHPVKRREIRLEGGREDSACDSIDPAHEERRDDHSQIRKIGERKNAMIDDELLERERCRIEPNASQAVALDLALDPHEDFCVDGLRAGVAAPQPPRGRSEQDL